MSTGVQSDAPIRAARATVEDYLHRRRPLWRHKLVDKLAEKLLGGSLLSAFAIVHADQQRAIEGTRAASRETLAISRLYRRQRDECVRDLYGTTDDWNEAQIAYLLDRFDGEFNEARRTKSLPPYQGPEEFWPEKPQVHPPVNP